MVERWRYLSVEDPVLAVVRGEQFAAELFGQLEDVALRGAHVGSAQVRPAEVHLAVDVGRRHRERPSSDSVAGFQHDHVEAVVVQQVGGAQT